MTEPLRFEPLEGRTPEETLQDPMRHLCKFNYQCRFLENCKTLCGAHGASRGTCSFRAF